jgi:hypothetical protein
VDVSTDEERYTDNEITTDVEREDAESEDAKCEDSDSEAVESEDTQSDNDERYFNGYDGFSDSLESEFDAYSTYNSTNSEPIATGQWSHRSY